MYLSINAEKQFTLQVWEPLVLHSYENFQFTDIIENYN